MLLSPRSKPAMKSLWFLAFDHLAMIIFFGFSSIAIEGISSDVSFLQWQFLVRRSNLKFYKNQISLLIRISIIWFTLFLNEEKSTTHKHQFSFRFQWISNNSKFSTASQFLSSFSSIYYLPLLTYWVVENRLRTFETMRKLEKSQPMSPRDEPVESWRLVQQCQTQPNSLSDSTF